MLCRVGVGAYKTLLGIAFVPSSFPPVTKQNANGYSQKKTGAPKSEATSIFNISQALFIMNTEICAYSQVHYLKGR